MTVYDQQSAKRVDSGLINAAAGFYFMTPALRQRLDLLRHLAEFSQQLLLVSAEKGAGKSAMLGEFVRQLDDAHRAVVLEATAGSSELQLVKDIAAGFNLSLNSSVELADAKLQLRQHLRTMEQALIVPLLIVDRAEQLTVELVKSLLEMGQEDQAGIRLRIVLFGRTPVDQLLVEAQRTHKYSGILHKLDIPLLCREEIGEFLTQLYLRDGKGFNPDSLDQQLDQLVSRTSGNPGKIMQIEDDILFQETDDKIEDVLHLSDAPEQTDGFPVFKTVALLFFLIVLAVGYYVLQPEGESSSELIPLELPSTMTEGSAIRAKQEPALEAVPVQLPNDEIKEVKLGQNNVPESEVKQQSVAVTETLPLEPTVDIPVEPDVVVPLLSEPAESAAVLPIELPKPAPEPTPPPVIKKIAEPPPVVSKQTAYRDRQWLMEQPAGSYVLQMLGMYEEKAVLEFLEQQKSPENFSFFVTRYKSRPWYVVVYGLYPNRDKAVAAIAKLPRDLRAQKPWARPVGDIQKLIQAVKQ